MVLPRLLHPIPTEIQSRAPATVSQDQGYREPVQTIGRSATFTILGQWKWFSSRELRMNKSGAEEGEDGYVLLRMIDLAAQSKKIARGDRIVGYGAGRGRVDLDVEVVKLRYEGHYPDQVGPALVKAFFSDRQPSRQTPGG